MMRIMRTTKRILVISIIGAISITGVTSCAAKMPASYTPQTKTLYVLTDVVNSIGTLQTAAENAVTQKYLSVDSARIIVQFCVAANTTIQQQPNGWYAIVNVAYQQAKSQLTSDELNKFSGALSAFEIVLNSFAPPAN